jgi:molybdopterin converting factor small subunit
MGTTGDVVQAIRVRITMYGLLTVAVRDPESVVDVELPVGSDVAGLIDTLAETSPMFDARSILAVANGVLVGHDHQLSEGEEIGLYHTFSGG